MNVFFTSRFFCLYLNDCIESRLICFFFIFNIIDMFFKHFIFCSNLVYIIFFVPLSVFRSVFFISHHHAANFFYCDSIASECVHVFPILPKTKTLVVRTQIYTHLEILYICVLCLVVVVALYLIIYYLFFFASFSYNICKLNID